MKISDCVVFVTGGTSGLGEATVRKFIEGGAKVAFLDLSEEKGNKLAEELGENSLFCKANVTDENEVKAAIEKTISKFGKLNVAVNVAGISAPKKVLGKTGPMALDDFTKVIDVNLIGTFNVMRLVSEIIAQNEPNGDGERGVIINTSSIASFHGQPGQTSYSASKGAINSMSLPVAREMAREGIRVLAIAPGLFYTPIYDTMPEAAVESLKKDMIFPKRFGRPEEFADLVRYAVTNVMLNGDVIRIDGAVRF